MTLNEIKTVRDAYDRVHEREKRYALFNGLTEDEANRHATKNAVKWAWIEFTISKEIK